MDTEQTHQIDRFVVKVKKELNPDNTNSQLGAMSRAQMVLEHTKNSDPPEFFSATQRSCVYKKCFAFLCIPRPKGRGFTLLAT